MRYFKEPLRVSSHQEICKHIGLFDLCIQNMNENRDRLRAFLLSEDFRAQIYVASIRYRYLATRGDLLVNNLYIDRIFNEVPFNRGKESTCIANVYTNLYKKFRDNQGTRPYYDYIKIEYAKINKNTCFYCNTRKIDALDHFIPESLFFPYVIASFNLIPSCTKCNSTLKGDYIGENILEAFIHPYFSEFLNDRWLYCRTSRSELGIVFEYYVNPPESWGYFNISRIKNQFKFLELDSSYSSEANNNLSDLWGFFQSVYESDNRNGIINELMRLKHSILLSRNHNYWEYVMYEALLEDENFLDGDFLNYERFIIS